MIAVGAFVQYESKRKKYYSLNSTGEKIYGIRLIIQPCLQTAMNGCVARTSKFFDVVNRHDAKDIISYLVKTGEKFTVFNNDYSFESKMTPVKDIGNNQEIENVVPELRLRTFYPTKFTGNNQERKNLEFRKSFEINLIPYPIELFYLADNDKAREHIKNCGASLRRNALPKNKLSCRVSKKERVEDTDEKECLIM